MNSARVMCWNVLEGFHVPRAQNSGEPRLDKNRLENAQAVVEECKPDVLVLNEALWCRPVQGHAFDYAQAFGFAHASAHLYDGVWGNVILSRWPLVREHVFRIYNRGGVLVETSVPAENGHKRLQVATYHPHPSRYPHHKAADFEELLAATSADVPLVLCGDFNAISPEDGVDPEKLARGFAAFSDSPGPDSARFLDGGRAVFQVLQSHGLRDSVLHEHRAPTMPTRLLAENPESAMRIDHLWVNAAVPVAHGQVVRTPNTDRASDHHPVLADLTWK